MLKQFIISVIKYKETIPYIKYHQIEMSKYNKIKIISTEDILPDNSKIIGSMFCEKEPVIGEFYIGNYKRCDN